ncbi:MAG: hypothetical protein EOO41_01050 [Methanobacteriota archaeon]|nr:MAG: hypothetical protein EOO41_01050 [Euryarchaeota archaeon]
MLLPVVLWDERHSSAKARALLKGGRRTTPPEWLHKTDEVAACVILDSFTAAVRQLAPQACSQLHKPVRLA